MEEERQITAAAEFEKRRMQQEEVQQRQDEEQKRRDEEMGAQFRKEEADRERQQLAVNAAMSSPEYLKLVNVCAICGAIQDKKSVEKALAVDAQYARKYGVVNYSRRDSAVQMIKTSDRMIEERKVEYKELFGKAFSPSVCKKGRLDNCEVNLKAMTKSLVERYLTRHP